MTFSRKKTLTPKVRVRVTKRSMGSRARTASSMARTQI